MRRTLALAFAAVAVIAAAVPARSAVVIAAVPGSFAATYGTPAAVARPGGSLTFANLDIQAHDVVSEATRAPGSAPWCPAGGPRCPLFFTDLIGLAQTAAVRGLHDIDPGTYAFYCNPHNWMTGTLVVL